MRLKNAVLGDYTAIDMLIELKSILNIDHDDDDDKIENIKKRICEFLEDLNRSDMEEL